jgi:hypothetical protein
MNDKRRCELARNRIVVLSGPNVWNRNTCATLVQAGLDVVGICMLRPHPAGVPFRYIWRSIGRRGLWTVVGQVLGRVYYNAFNKRDDLKIRRTLFDEERIDAVLRSWEGDGGEVFLTENYSSPESLQWLRRLAPDVLVVHTGGWVGREVREIPSKRVVIGGHPGLTPQYRGAHSAFWAVYMGKPEDVGWSVFWIDKGVDTGDLIVQDVLEIEAGDSYVTLGWKGMLKEAEAQAMVLLSYDDGEAIPRRPHACIPPRSEFAVPTILEYLRYRTRQNRVR